MVKTQIQVPHHLYHEAKRLARTHEMSLAEVFRRGLECVLAVYPRTEAPPSQWHLPKPRPMGWQGVTAERLRDLASETATELQMRHRPRKHVVR